MTSKHINYIYVGVFSAIYVGAIYVIAKLAYWAMYAIIVALYAYHCNHI